MQVEQRDRLVAAPPTVDLLIGRRGVEEAPVEVLREPGVARALPLCVIGAGETHPRGPTARHRPDADGRRPLVARADQPHRILEVREQHEGPTLDLHRRQATAHGVVRDLRASERALPRERQVRDRPRVGGSPQVPRAIAEHGELLADGADLERDLRLLHRPAAGRVKAPDDHALAPRLERVEVRRVAKAPLRVVVVVHVARRQRLLGGQRTLSLGHDGVGGLHHHGQRRFGRARLPDVPRHLHRRVLDQLHRVLREGRMVAQPTPACRQPRAENLRPGVSAREGPTPVPDLRVAGVGRAAVHGDRGGRAGGGGRRRSTTSARDVRCPASYSLRRLAGSSGSKSWPAISTWKASMGSSVSRACPSSSGSR